MSRKPKLPDSDVIRLSHVAEPVVPSFTITNLSEADIRITRPSEDEETLARVDTTDG